MTGTVKEEAVRKSILLFALVILVASAPTLAGEGHKCTASTQDCLNMMAKSLKKERPR